MNPVSSGKSLGFVVHRRGIEIDPSKIRAIQEMPRPVTVKQFKSFLGKVSYIRRFIPYLSEKVRPLMYLLKKDAKFVWAEHCEQALLKMKKELLSPPTLMAPIPAQVSL
ncbi:hypothetical protein CsSME_00054668 [Camellia sinensis var. sinensis]